MKKKILSTVVLIMSLQFFASCETMAGSGPCKPCKYNKKKYDCGTKRRIGNQGWKTCDNGLWIDEGDYIEKHFGGK